MKKKVLLDFLENVSTFSQQELNLIDQHSTTKHYKKGSFITSYGEICNEVSLVLQGVIRFYILNEQGDEMTTAFILRGELAARIESFLKQSPSNGYLVCETDCDLITISKENWDFLCQNTKNFGFALTQYGAIGVAQKLEFQRRLLNLDARSAYLEFAQRHQHVIDQVPLKHIANYLGITPSSLSRVRNNLS